MLVITLLLGVIGVTLLVYLLSKIAKLTDDLSQKNWMIMQIIYLTKSLINLT